MGGTREEVLGAHHYCIHSLPLLVITSLTHVVLRDHYFKWYIGCEVSGRLLERGALLVRATDYYCFALTSMQVCLCPDALRYVRIKRFF